MMHVDVDVENALMVLEKLQNGKDNIIDVAESSRLNRLP